MKPCSWILVVFTILIAAPCMGQKQNNNWCFGYNGGLSFNTNPPSQFASAFQTEEASTTVSDRNTGELLFYCNNRNVWDKNHNIMTNGFYVGTDKLGTCAQGTLAVPFINDPQKYYLFNLSEFASSGILTYSVVDMAMNSGRGDVDPSQKAIYIDSLFTEGMVAIPGCSDVWLVLMKRLSNQFYAYRISDKGLNTTPVISTVNYRNKAIGLTTFKGSPDGSKIAMAVWDAENDSTYVGLADFDLTTGRISNEMTLGERRGREFYGIEFSPSGKRLYAEAHPSYAIYQFDISLPTEAAIQNSMQKIHQDNQILGGMQLAPDSNIYITRYNVTSLDRISNADALYPNCIYTTHAIKLDTGSTKHNLPGLVVYPKGGVRTEPGVIDSLKICGDDYITLTARTGTNAYEWSNGGNHQTTKINAAGEYYVTMNFNCLFITDTFEIKKEAMQVDVVGDSAICPGDTVMLLAKSNYPNAQFTWGDGSVGDTLYVSEPGNYGITSNFLDCRAYDNTVVTQIPKILMELGEDREICKGEQVVLPELASITQFDTVVWSDGSGKRNYYVKEEGTYSVAVYNRCETTRDTVTIKVRNCFLFFPNAFTPNGDGRNDVARMVGDIPGISKYSIYIFNRWGNEVFHNEDVTQGWDGMHNGEKAAPDMYKYIIQYTYLGKGEVMKGDIMLIR